MSAPEVPRGVRRLWLVVSGRLRCESGSQEKLGTRASQELVEGGSELSRGDV